MFQLLGELFGFLLSLFGSSKVSDKSDIDRIERQIEEREARKTARDRQQIDVERS